MFTEGFDQYVVQGDQSRCIVDGFTVIATLHHDGDTEPQGDNPALAEWRNDEWHYFGVAVTVWRDGAQLIDDYAHARWGIEGNYPAADERANTNSYFLDVANDLLPEALADAKDKIHKWAKELNYV